MRVLLFVATNLGVLIVASITLRLLGVDTILQDNGVDLDVNALLVFCAVFGFGGAFVSLALSKRMALWSTSARIIGQPANRVERWLTETVARQARDAGIGTPEVAVFPSVQPNAFATGANRNRALVAVSEGLLETMDQREVEAVIGHEIGHVANGDMVTLTLIQGVLNTFVMFFARIIGFFVDRVVLRNERGLGIGYFVASIAAELVLGILATIVVLWFSRRREFRADEAGADLAGRGSMIAALERLRAHRSAAADLPASLTAFGISGPRVRLLQGLFATHPPLEARIAALRAQETGAVR